MEDVLLKLKRLLNSIDDEELKETTLWIDAEVQVQTIIFESENITFITDKEKLKYDGLEL